MAPRGADTWSEANKLRFVMYIAYALGGSPHEHWAAIAGKMGPDYTPAALKSKWQRLRAEVDKQGGIGLATPASKDGKKAATPRKTAGVGEEDGGTPTGGRKRKANSATPKSKKAKVEMDGELDAGEAKEEPEAKSKD